MIRGAAFLVWGLIFASGLAAIVYRQHYTRERAVVVRALPVNHLIQIDDLNDGSDTLDFVGKYLRGSAKPGQVLISADVSSVPLIAAEPGPLFVLPLKMNGARPGKLDAGDKAQLCNKTDAAIKGLEVVAVTCPDENACAVLFRASLAEATKIADLIGAKDIPNDLAVKRDCK
jgi:hypothetical protein